MDLLDSIPLNKRKYKTLFGGVFATYAADKVIKSNLVDYVCRGEGEDAVVEICNLLSSGGRIDNVRNFTIKENGNIYNNPMRPPVDINDVPIQIGICLNQEAYIGLCKCKIWKAVGLETKEDVHIHALFL